MPARRASATPPGEGPKRDLEQTEQAIDGARALLPLLEPRHGDELAPVKDALSRLQMAYVQLSGGNAAGRRKPASPKRREGPGPAQPPAACGFPGSSSAVDSRAAHTAARSGLSFRFV